MYSVSDGGSSFPPLGRTTLGDYQNYLEFAGITRNQASNDRNLSPLSSSLVFEFAPLSRRESFPCGDVVCRSHARAQDRGRPGYYIIGYRVHSSPYFLPRSFRGGENKWNLCVCSTFFDSSRMNSCHRYGEVFKRERCLRGRVLRDGRC